MAAPLLAIVGPTASGKTALAIDLARKYDGEIICADSRTVYKGMDIGTAKPTPAEQAAVPHHLLDVVAPDEPFTALDFKRQAMAAIDDIHARGKLPLLVGGSGLYIDAVLYDYQFADAPRSMINPRHRAEGAPRADTVLRSDTLIVGVDKDKAVLEERIRARVDVMVKEGFLDEVRRLSAAYAGSKALDAPGYRAFADYLAGSITLEEAKTRFVRNDCNLAKRQRTWLRRNQQVRWIQNSADADSLVAAFLAKY